MENERFYIDFGTYDNAFKTILPANPRKTKLLGGAGPDFLTFQVPWYTDAGENVVLGLS